MNIIVNSLIVNYDRQGKGRPILLLHGWGDSLKTFDSMLKEFSDLYEVITIDLPGFGGTQAPAEAWGLGEYAQFIADFLNKINVDIPYAIVGHSNGGAIAIRGLSEAQLKTNNLVLVSSAGIRDQAGGRKLIWKVVAKAGKVVTSVLPVSTRQRLRKHLYSGIGSDYLVAAHMEDTFKKVVSEDVQSYALTIHVPTLLIYGSEDTATPPKYGEIFSHAIAGSKLHIVEGAGHFVHQERAQEITRRIKEFIK